MNAHETDVFWRIRGEHCGLNESSKSCFDVLILKRVPQTHALATCSSRVGRVLGVCGAQWGRGVN